MSGLETNLWMMVITGLWFVVFGIAIMAGIPPQAPPPDAPQVLVTPAPGGGVHLAAQFAEGPPQDV